MISWLEKDFEHVKDQFANGSLLPIFAKFEIEKIMKDVNKSLKVLNTVSDKDSVKRRFIALDKQLQDFDKLLDAHLGSDQQSTL